MSSSVILNTHGIGLQVRTFVLFEVDGMVFSKLNPDSVVDLYHAMLPLLYEAFKQSTEAHFLLDSLARDLNKSHIKLMFNH